MIICIDKYKKIKLYKNVFVIRRNISGLFCFQLIAPLVFVLCSFIQFILVLGLQMVRLFNPEI